MYNITNIEKIYPNWYDPSHSFSKDDQKWIWENTPLPLDDEERLNITPRQRSNNIKENNGGDVNLNGGIGTYKQPANSKTKLTKLDAINKLKTFNYRSTPKEIAYYLEILFANFQSYDGHWLYIAQKYNPRTINRVINLIMKQYMTGESIVKNPAAYFTSLIKRRKQRKSLRIPLVLVKNIDKSTSQFIGGANE